MIPTLTIVFVVFISLIFDLHKDLDGGLDVVQHGQAVELEQTLSFLLELFLTETVNLNKE